MLNLATLPTLVLLLFAASAQAELQLEATEINIHYRHKEMPSCRMMVARILELYRNHENSVAIANKLFKGERLSTSQLINLKHFSFEKSAGLDVFFEKNLSARLVWDLTSLSEELYSRLRGTVQMGVRVRAPGIAWNDPNAVLTEEISPTFNDGERRLELEFSYSSLERCAFANDFNNEFTLEVFDTKSLETLIAFKAEL